MAPYNNTQFGPKAFLVSQNGPTYLLGGRAATGGDMNVVSVATAANVATVGVQSWEGNLPVVGTLVTIRGTSQATGAYNVTNVPLTAVNLDTNGNGTVSFALTSANLATTADGGKLRFAPQVTYEAIANGNASMAGAISSSRHKEVFAECFFGTLPTAVTVALQAAMVNEDSAFQTLGNVCVVAAGAVSVNGASFDITAPFVRFIESGLTGSGTIAAMVTE